MPKAPSSLKCEHGFCGHVRKERLLQKRWNARIRLTVGPRTLLLCESCVNVVLTQFRQNGHQPELTPLDDKSRA